MPIPPDNRVPGDDHHVDDHNEISDELTALVPAEPRPRARARQGSNLSDLASAATARTNLGLTGAATASLPLAIGSGGTGQATRQAAQRARRHAERREVLRSDGTNAALASVAAADCPPPRQAPRAR